MNHDDLPLGSNRPVPTDVEETTDTALGAPAVTEEDAAYGIEDATSDVAPEDFDFSAFVEGSRSHRRRVTLSMRGDLIATMETLKTRIEWAEQAGDTEAIAVLEAEAEKILADYEAGRRPIIVEARGTEWIQGIEKQAKKQHGLDPKKPDDRLTIMLRQIAGQIVHPTKGVTVEALRHLYETNEPEIDKLWRACQSANRGTGVVPDFSRKPSVTSRNG